MAFWNRNNTPSNEQQAKTLQAEIKAREKIASGMDPRLESTRRHKATTTEMRIDLKHLKRWAEQDNNVPCGEMVTHGNTRSGNDESRYRGEASRGDGRPSGWDDRFYTDENGVTRMR